MKIGERICNLQTYLLAATCLSAFMATPCHAQEVSQDQAESEALGINPAQTADQEENAIVVSGIRESLDQAVRRKRDAVSIVDAISAEDIGKFPDANIAESVQRIAGVQINRTRGEGRSVNIRGLPANFTMTTLNGRLLPNAISDVFAQSSRTFDFSILAPEFVRTLDVAKSPTSDMEEGGLSGNVNIFTPHALSAKQGILVGSVQSAYQSMSGKVAPRASFIFADRFLDGRLGVTFGASYKERYDESHSAIVNYATAREAAGRDFDGNGLIDSSKIFRVPSSAFHNITNDKTDRLGTIASIEYEASDGLRLFADGFFSRLKKYNYSLNQFATYSSSPVINSKSELLEGAQTVTSIRYSRVDLRALGPLEDSEGDVAQLVGGVSLNRAAWKFDVSGSYAESTQARSNLRLANTFVSAAGPSSGVVSYTSTPGDLLGSTIYEGDFDQARLVPTNYRIISLNGEFNRASADRLWDLKADLRHEISGGPLTLVAAGLRIASRRIHQDNKALSITLPGIGALRPDIPLGPTPNSLSASPFLKLIGPGHGSFLGSYSGKASFPSSFLVSDYRSILAGLTDEQIVAAGTLTNDGTGIVNVREQTLAGYLRLDWQLGGLAGNAGLRAVRTRQASIGGIPDFNSITNNQDAGNIVRLQVSPDTEITNNYTDLLPSLNIKWDATDQLVFRFAAARTMTRPNLVDVSPSATVSTLTLSITKNNPRLDPFRADNLDLTAEYYLGSGGLVGTSLFYKRLKTLVRSEVTAQTLPVLTTRNRVTAIENVTFAVSELVNGSGVTVKGAEIYYQQPFTFLPSPLDGLGVIFNYTFIDNSDPVQLTAASKHNANGLVYYEKGPLGVRLSYSWRDAFLATAPSFPVMGTEARAFGTLDGSINLKVTEQLSMTLEAINITDADDVRMYTTNLPFNYTDSGRTIVAGLRFSF